MNDYFMAYEFHFALNATKKIHVNHRFHKQNRKPTKILHKAANATLA